eukprot:Phypoly_transcript_04587.p1 GENE.Phypoly_transcript_04587~~Phypoly_transcript_04587.p1  ORF type:complete len:342 (-),score=93.55 Phypoly_transcript_04587:56-1081(-)
MFHTPAVAITRLSTGPERIVAESEEDKNIVLDDLDDLEDTELQIYDLQQASSSTTPANKLINKSSPFPLPNEFYLYTPLGKLDKCMQCKAAFTTSHMLANHIVNVHPKVPKNPKPIPKHPNLISSNVNNNNNSTNNTSKAIQIYPSAEFHGPAAFPVKRPRGRPPRNIFGPNSQVPEESMVKRHKPNEQKPTLLPAPANTTPHKNNTTFNINNNNNNNNNTSNKNSHTQPLREIYPAPPSTPPNHSIESLKKPIPPNTPSIPISQPTPVTPPSLHATQTSNPPSNTTTSPPADNPKVLNLENLSKKIENLAMLRKVTDQGLITEQQYQQKQEEFLQSVSFL